MSDTGIESSEEFEFLQYYDYLCLDVFAETKPHVASELENWLNFLTIRMTDEMERFIEKHPEFSEIYDESMIFLSRFIIVHLRSGRSADPSSVG